MLPFDEHSHATLATLFNAPDYQGYKPTVREAPNGDGVIDAKKKFLHVAMKYNPPAWARSYLASAHHIACEIAERIGVPDAFYPRIADGTLRVLEYPSAAHEFDQTSRACVHCGGELGLDAARDVCPALAAGAGTAEHTDFDLFTVNLWRSTSKDHEQRAQTCQSCDGRAPYCKACGGTGRPIADGIWLQGAREWHLGEIGELVGLGRAVPHRVPARPYVQKALVYFAMPSHAARLPGASCAHAFDTGTTVRPHACGFGLTVGEWLKERTARSRVEYK